MTKVISYTLAAILIGVSNPTFADTFLGGKVGADLTLGKTSVDGQDGSDNALGFYASLEHLVPFVPNVRVKLSSVSTANVSFSQRDVTGYYEILDNGAITLDLGYTFSEFSSAKVDNVSFSESHGGFYGLLDIHIPTTSMDAFVRLNQFGSGGSSTSERELGMKYNMLGDFVNIRGGYRTAEHNFGKDNSPNVRLNGWFIGVESDF